MIRKRRRNDFLDLVHTGHTANFAVTFQNYPRCSCSFRYTYEYFFSPYEHLKFKGSSGASPSNPGAPHIFVKQRRILVTGGCVRHILTYDL